MVIVNAFLGVFYILWSSKEAGAIATGVYLTWSLFTRPIIDFFVNGSSTVIYSRGGNAKTRFSIILILNSVGAAIAAILAFIIIFLILKDYIVAISVACLLICAAIEGPFLGLYFRKLQFSIPAYCNLFSTVVTIVSFVYTCKYFQGQASLWSAAAVGAFAKILMFAAFNRKSAGFQFTRKVVIVLIKRLCVTGLSKSIAGLAREAPLWPLGLAGRHTFLALISRGNRLAAVPSDFMQAAYGAIIGPVIARGGALQKLGSDMLALVCARCLMLSLMVATSFFVFFERVIGPVLGDEWSGLGQLAAVMTFGSGFLLIGKICEEIARVQGKNRDVITQVSLWSAFAFVLIWGTVLFSSNVLCISIAISFCYLIRVVAGLRLALSLQHVHVLEFISSTVGYFKKTDLIILGLTLIAAFCLKGNLMLISYILLGLGVTLLGLLELRLLKKFADKLRDLSIH